MKYLVRILAVSAAMFCFCNSAQAQKISFYPTDARTQTIVENLFTEYNAIQKNPVRAQAAWLTLKPGTSPYLFARSIDHCGAHGCEIYGFRQDESGQWVKIYQQYGEKGLSILETMTEGHYDLEHWDVNEKGGYHKKISRWAGKAYGAPDITEQNITLVSPRSSNNDNCGIETKVCKAADLPGGQTVPDQQDIAP